ncbi:MAG: DUF4358 domain-containing protein [Anaerovorax sp.]
MINKNKGIRFIKRGIAATLLLCLILVMGSCGDKNKEWTSFTEPLAEELMDKVAFADELAPVDMNIISTMYGVDESMLVDYKVLMSSGGTADEVAIFFAKNDKYANEIRTVVDARVEDQKAVMENYLPEEMDKLNNAIVSGVGPYVILCVTEDTETAKEIIDDYLK